MTGSPLPIVRTVAALRETVRAWKRDGQRVALVPTMGALHDGHLSLIRLGLSHADKVVASVFVNPTQFAPHEDFDKYPRNEAQDAALLAGAGCGLMFAPGVEEMYAPGFSTTVTVAGVSAPLEGAMRPTHFAGVATVVAKLLNQAEPDVAIFGEKDYQQLQVIRAMARDLDLPVQILGAPTARAPDGLALSSRNAYLSPAERQVAAQINLTLARAVSQLRAGEPVEKVEAAGAAALRQAGFDRVDYFAVRGADDLSERTGPLKGPARVLTAAVIGRTRLIDNMAA